MRIAVQFAAAGWVVYWLGGMPRIRIVSDVWSAGWAGAVVALEATFKSGR